MAHRFRGRAVLALVAPAACVAGLAQFDALAASVSRSGVPSARGSVSKVWDGSIVRNLDATAARAATSGGAPASGVAPPYAIKPPSPGPASVRLSNERTSTTWANPVRRAGIYAGPSTGARRVGSLHMRTEDGFPEVYLLLREDVGGRSESWVQLRIPARPNGQTGWVLRSALGAFQQSHWLLVVSRRRRRLTAYWWGHLRYRAPVGIGKPSSPTPPGHFWIRERFKILDRSSPYWPYAIGTSDYSTLTDWPGGGVVGIHGWNQPSLIPGDPSHGCIRMHAADVTWVALHVPVGTPLHII